jgi:hypothetical protein
MKCQPEMIVQYDKELMADCSLDVKEAGQLQLSVALVSFQTIAISNEKNGFQLQ